MENNSVKIWKEHQTELKYFVRSKIKDNDSAKDILQEVFIKLYQNVFHLQQPEKIKAWLFTVTRNLINDYYRNQKFHKNIDDLEISEKSDPDSYQDSNITSSFSNCLHSLIQQLPEKNKEAITLVELKQIDQKQLSKKLNISYSGAKSRVQRGREMLKEYIEKCCEVVHDKYGNILSLNPRSECVCGLSCL